VGDVVRSGHFMDFVQLLIEIGDTGLMGRKYAVPYMREILSGVFDLGYLYDTENQLFVENPDYSITRNWGALKEGVEYAIAFMRLDVVGNSAIVRENPADHVHAAYEALREISQHAVLQRSGRIWGWDGDGGLAAFFFGNKNQSAVMAGREILHELFFFNRIGSLLEKPLEVRIAVHTGPFLYTQEEEDLMTSETIKRLLVIESSYTSPGTMTVSPVVQLMLDAIASTGLQAFIGKDNLEYHRYQLALEKV